MASERLPSFTDMRIPEKMKQKKKKENEDIFKEISSGMVGKPLRGTGVDASGTGCSLLLGVRNVAVLGTKGKLRIVQR